MGGQRMIEIRSRFDGRVLYAAETAQDVRAAAVQAVAAESSLYGANLRGADLRGANLRGANLREADLHGAGILHIDGLPSGSATLIPDPDGWVLQIGCWRGTITELREMIARDDGWPEAVGAQIVERRPMLAALADMADAWAAVNQLLLERVRKLHGTKTAVIA